MNDESESRKSDIQHERLRAVMNLKPDWQLKRDPEKHPVRFLAGIWQERLTDNFGVTGTQLTPKELGQMKSLRKALGDLTPDVIEWMLDPINWWHFCQQVRAESGSQHAPSQPHVGYLLAHHAIGLKIMHSRLRHLTPTPDFVVKLERKRYEEIKTFLLAAYAEGKPERLAKIGEAKTLTDMRRVFIEMTDESTAA